MKCNKHNYLFTLRILFPCENQGVTELPSVLWVLRTIVNRATRDMPFNLVYSQMLYYHLKYIFSQQDWHILILNTRQKLESLIPSC
jgi:hypothetical protein